MNGKPSLANDKDFLHDNSELAHFLNAHPYVQSALREDPVGFMQRVRDFEIYGSYYNDEAMRGQLAGSTSSWPIIRGSPKSCVRTPPGRTIRISCTTIRSCATT